MKSGNLNFLEPSGHFGPVTGLIYLTFFKIMVDGWAPFRRDCHKKRNCVCVCVCVCVFAIYFN